MEEYCKYTFWIVVIAIIVIIIYMITRRKITEPFGDVQSTSAQLELISNGAANKCRSAIAPNSLKASAMKFNPDPVLCKGQNMSLSIDKITAADADCYIGKYQAGLADLISKMDITTQQVLGFIASTDSKFINYQIENVLNQFCGSSSAITKANTTDLGLGLGPTCSPTLFQNASVQSICKLKKLQEVAGEVRDILDKQQRMII